MLSVKELEGAAASLLVAWDLRVFTEVRKYRICSNIVPKRC